VKPRNKYPKYMVQINSPVTFLYNVAEVDWKVTRENNHGNADCEGRIWHRHLIERKDPHAWNWANANFFRPLTQKEKLQLMFEVELKD